MIVADDLVHEFEVARRVLTDVEYETWVMAKRGFSRTAIALHRGKAKGTINACLTEAKRKIDEAMDDEG